ncbi:MAG: DUF2892 domain-containing protein [Bdellovibrionales bacterium]|nr:DUF2892 domain-containing protein [Bdellovibrionales bacterium]
MQPNVGSTDKIIRFALAIGLFSLFFFLEGDMRWVAALGVVPLITGAINFCPLYKIIGLSTKK